MNKFGITEKSYQSLIEVINRYPQIKQAVMFGSRAKGNYKPGSDIDIAIIGPDCTDALALDISAQLNERTPSPYKFDIVNYNTIQSNELKEHIDRVGVDFK